MIAVNTGNLIIVIAVIIWLAVRYFLVVKKK
jgi:hypothetical protein